MAAVTMAAGRVGRINGARRMNVNRRTKMARNVTAKRGALQTTAFTPINYAVSGSTAMMLLLGRFVFRDFQKTSLSKQGLPVQNGQTHFEAGDDRAQEQEGVVTASFGDPSQFGIVDVLSWGSLGHAIGFTFAVLYNNSLYTN